MCWRRWPAIIDGTPPFCTKSASSLHKGRTNAGLLTFRSSTPRESPLMKFTLRPGYALAALALFLVEVAIALWVKERFIRPYGGDVLATILVYLALRAVTDFRVIPAALAALAISLMVEIAQARDLVTALGLSHNETARTVLGTSFAVGDLAAYSVGAIMVIIVERSRGAI